MILAFQLPVLMNSDRTAKGASEYTQENQANGIDRRDGSSITNCSRTTYAGSYGSLVCTTCATKTGPYQHLKTSSAVHPHAPSTISAVAKLPSDVFGPLFEVTKDRTSHPELHVFLQRVIGFDTVDDESKAERLYHKKFSYPKDWNYDNSPPYSHW